MANNKLQIAGQSGVTLRAVIKDRTNDDVWDGADLITYVDADLANYKITVPELGHGDYGVAVPSALPAGRYHVIYYDNDSDEVFAQAFISWDGVDVAEELETGDVSVTDICNMALSHLGIGTEVGDVETDRTEAAKAFNRFYQPTRDEMLEEFAYPWAMVTVSLGLVEADPTDEWAYSYRYPSNCLKLKRIQSGVRNDDPDSRVPYRVSRDATGKLIYTDVADAVMEYQFRETDPGRFNPLFVTALSFMLAFKMAPRMTKGDPFKLGVRALELARLWIAKAQVSSAGEEVPEREPESELIRSRD